MAPRFFAIWMLSRMRARFPSKSRLHWFSEHVATVISVELIVLLC